MKKVSLWVLFLLSGLTYAQVGVGTENPESSAMFQVESSNKGVLITRVPLSGTNDTTTIASPTEGLLIYNTAMASFGDTAVSPGFYYFNGTEWKRLLNTGNVVSNTASITANTLAISNLPGAVFTGNTTVASNIYTTTQDFVFGSSSLDDVSGDSDDARFFFDKSKAAFRAGIGFRSDWDEENIGDYSIVLGDGLASGMGAIAFGGSNIVTSNNAIAIGGLNVVKGDISTAIGFGLQTNSFSELVVGSYNIELDPDEIEIDTWQELDPIFTVGNGESWINRSNAFQILKNGDATFNDNLTVNKDLFVEGDFSTDGDIGIGGRVSAGTFVGDGSGLTGISTGVSSSTFKDSYLNIAIGTDMKSLTSSKTLYEEDGITYFDNYEGYANIAIGDSTLLLNTIGNYNTAIGFQALLNNKDGWSNVALGTYALKNNTEGYANIAIGEEVLLENTKGNYNVALGVSALYNNTTGDDNVAIGEYVLSSNTTGNENVAIGKYALENNTTGENNLAIGASALYNNSDGGYNVAIGNWPLQNNTEGNDNVAIGNWPLQNNTEGYDNVAIGKYALEVNTTGANNIAIGHYAGRSIDEDAPETLNGYNNIFLGPFTTIELDGIENSVAIGSGASLTQSNTIQLGNEDISTVITSGTVSATAFVGDGSRLTGLEESIFTGNASLTSNVYSATQDFIFGSNTTDDISGTYDDARFYFLKAKAAFGAGYFPSLVSENGFLSSYDITDFDPYDVGDYSINLGNSNEASDLGAIAIGILNTTRAYGAKAMGDYLMANSSSEIVIGSYNEYSEDSQRIVWNPLDPLFTVGNGDFNSVDKKRSNAFRILKNGDATFYNSLTVSETLTVNQGIETSGTVTATAFVGNGSGLTGVLDQIALDVSGASSDDCTYGGFIIKIYLDKNGNDSIDSGEMVLSTKTNCSAIGSIDTDSDGVPNIIDDENNTPSGTTVDSSGVAYLKKINNTIVAANTATNTTYLLNGVTYKVVNNLDELKSALENDDDMSKKVTTRVSSMKELFKGKETFNEDIGDWDVSKVTNMSGMFASAEAFNRDLGNWDVSNVKDMSEMFYDAFNFNEDIGDWDVSSVTNMSSMFNNATNFNQNIESWEVSSVINMSSMFNDATSYDKDLGDWNVSKVTNMSNMFNNATNFNKYIGDWDVSRVTNMSYMFNNATNFNQNISEWNLAVLNEYSYFRTNSALTDGNTPDKVEPISGGE